MKTLKWVVVSSGWLLAFQVQASTVKGTIHFTGLVYTPASAALPFGHSQQASTARDKHIYSLATAQKLIRSDAFDYFASYAPQNAELVSVTYN